MKKNRYDIAVSFAGEDRVIVEKFVNALTMYDISVFYDSWEQAQLWGKDLYQYLDLIYQQAARFCIIFVSENCVKKAWTKHELRSAQARAFQQNSEYILPIKLDDTELPGLPNTIAYIDFRHTPIKDIVDMLSKKIGAAKKPNLEEIVDKIKSGEKENRLHALREINVFQLKELLDIVIDTMLNDKSSEVRQSAAFTLDNLNDERALQPLIQAIHDNVFSVRSTAGWGLVHLGDKVIPYMKEIIEKSDNAEAREMARLVLINL
jgi:hypothetical protein